jgi:predicted RNase H-like HicB family nuclease
MSQIMPIRLPAVVRKDEETGAFISYIPKLDLYSAAMSEDEAVQAAQSAVDLFFRTAATKGTLMQVLLETGLLSTGEEESLSIEDHKFYTGTPLHLSYGMACV